MRKKKTTNDVVVAQTPPLDNSMPIDIFKHCIGWNSYNIPRVGGNKPILFSYRNRFVLNKGDTYLDKAVKEGYMLKSNYCDKFFLYTLTDKGFRYIEEHEDITIVRNVDLQALHKNYKPETTEETDTPEKKKKERQPSKKKSTDVKSTTDADEKKRKAQEYAKQYYLRKKKQKQGK